MKMTKQGFTLVELLVAIGLFSILFAIAGGGFVNALRAQRQVSAIMAAQSNTSIALEEMAREIRTGYLFCHDLAGARTCDVPGDPLRHCIRDLLTGWDSCSSLEFYNASGQKIDYILQNGVLERGVDDTYQAVTGNNVNVKEISFILNGNAEADHWNPRITIAVGIAPNDSSISWDTINFETSVSAREIDCAASGPTPC